MSEENVAGTMPSMCNNRLPRRVKFTDQQLEKASLEDMIRSWHEQDLFIDFLESQATSLEADLANSREAEERMRQQHLESTHREKVLVRRLATKEQEMQEYASQIAEFKAGQTAGSSALRSALLDPAVNLLLQRLRGEHLSTQTRLEETQNELSAWKFTPDSNTGKRLMAKCRLLYQENEELGRMISSGRLAKLEGELALQKSFSDEVKKSQSELDEFLQDLDEDVEGMQSTIYYLQQELRKAKDINISLLQQQMNQINQIQLVSERPRSSAKKEQSPLPATEIKSEHEVLSPKPPSPLEDATSMTSIDHRSPDAQIDIVEEESMLNDVAEKTECSDSGLETGNLPGVANSDIDSFMDTKIDAMDKVPKSEDSIDANIVTINPCHTASNDHDIDIADENKEESDDPDSQGELMIEVGSEPRDSEDEESPEKSKEKGNLLDGVVMNGMMSRFERNLTKNEDAEEKISPPVHRKRPAPESIPNSSDEDSDDTPLIKKVRRNHEITLKSKTGS